MNDSPYGPPPAQHQPPAQPPTGYGPPPGPPPQQQPFAPAQQQYGQPQYGQQQYGQPQSGQPQYGVPTAAPYASPYGVPNSGRRGKGMMIAGPIIFLVGVLITVVTYEIAPPGGAYLISFGPMLWGVIWFIRGLIAYNNSR